MRDYNNKEELNHPWHIVVAAQLQKYPNPYAEDVIGIDVLNQRFRNDGVVQIERIIQSKFNESSWKSLINKCTGSSHPNQYSLECTQIDPRKRELTMITRNLTLFNWVSFNERITYRPDPADRNKTIRKQGTNVVVNLPYIFADLCEKGFISIYQQQAQNGRKGLEWAINELMLGGGGGEQAQRAHPHT